MVVNMLFNKDMFIELCGGNKLKPRQKDGLLFLISSMELDKELTDIRWLAYLFATIQRECADTYQPIEEYGKGKNKPYGKLINGKAYYGRGYVQLTWLDNYKTMSKIVGYDLVSAPEIALQPIIAYQIMSHGMRHGSFTGVSLSKYINETKCDYINARKIINSLDHAVEIAKVAEWFEQVLKDCLIEG